MNNRNSLGFQILIIIGIIILIMLLVGQTGCLIDYEFTVSLGLQEPVNDIGLMGVAVGKAFGVGDTIIYSPLLFIGLLGLWLKKEWGLWSMICALGITAYWPIVNIFIILFAEGTPGFNYPNFTSILIILILITIYAIWGLAYLYKTRRIFS